MMISNKEWCSCPGGLFLIGLSSSSDHHQQQQQQQQQQRE
jgi:hypothetical protein